MKHTFLSTVSLLAISACSFQPLVSLADEHCPILPPSTKKMHWPLKDPAKAHGTEEDIMAQFRAARDDIRHRIEHLISQL